MQNTVLTQNEIFAGLQAMCWSVFGIDKNQE